MIGKKHKEKGKMVQGFEFIALMLSYIPTFTL